MSAAAVNGAVLNRAVLNGMSRTTPLPRLRMTRRGRRVVMFLVALPLVIAAGAFALNGGMAAATDTAASSSLQYVTVGAGETLWQLAGELAPAADPRDVISDILHLNQLQGTDIQAGQRLAIPAKYSR